jgi:FG-GAP repeat
MKQCGSKILTSVAHSNGSRLGEWLLNTADNFFGPVAHFSNTRRAGAFVSSPWGIGILTLAGSGMTSSMLKPNGTRFGGWLLNTADNSFGPSGDFDGDGISEILVTNPWGVGILKQSGPAMGNRYPKACTRKFHRADDVAKWNKIWRLATKHG